MNDFYNLPGVYGKIPALGDFVSRRLTSDFIAAWDIWLQNGLSASKEQLGSQWIERYLSSPIWHFVLSSGICGKTPWAGILMPSVDKVGRYFPLTFAAQLSPDHNLADVFLSADTWFKNMEQLALSALEDGLDIAALDQQLQTLDLPNPSIPNPLAVKDLGDTDRDDSSAFCMFSDTWDQIKDALAQKGFNLLTRSRPSFSLWRTTGSVSMKPCLRVYENFPPMDDFSKLLYAQEKPVDDNTTQVNSSLPSDVVYQTISIRSPEPEDTPEMQHIQEITHHQWSSFASTNIGKQKEINEDAYLERSEIGLWAIADGVAVRPVGETSSKMAINALGALMATGNLESYVEYATECLRSVNTTLLNIADQDSADRAIGTSIAVMLAVGKQCAVIWSGNCRLYQLRDTILTQVTMDHLRSTENLNNDEKKPIFTNRLLGVRPEFSFDLVSFEAKTGDLYLLCSDGLVNEVNHREIEDIMKQGRCRPSTQGLIELALERDAKDNITVIVSRLSA